MEWGGHLRVKRAFRGDAWVMRSGVHVPFALVIDARNFFALPRRWDCYNRREPERQGSCREIPALLHLVRRTLASLL